MIKNGLSTSSATESDFPWIDASMTIPAHVAGAVRFGLSKGWTPNKAADDCWIAFDVDANGESLLEFIPNDHFRVVTYSTLGKLPDGIDSSQYPDTRMWDDRPVTPKN